MVLIDEKIEIYIKLLADEEGTLRPTQAVNVGKGLFEVLPIPNYENLDEIWEFLPGSIVRINKKSIREKSFY